MKTWVINGVSVNDDDYHRLIVGLTTKEWITISGDEGRPGNATTFVWIILDKNNQLTQVGFLPHGHVTEEECLAQVRVLLAIVRPFEPDGDPKRYLGRVLPQRGVP